MSSQLERIRARLGEAGLKVAAAKVEEILETAVGRGDDPLVFLDNLLDEELTKRRAARIERRVKVSKLPQPFKTLESFDWDFQPKLDKGRVQALARLDFLESHLNILFTGKSGTGKSHLAQALAYVACGQDKRVLYTSCAKMLGTLFGALADHSLERKLRLYQRVELLVIDDLGTEKVEILHGQGASLFFKVINGRYGKASTILTSNLDTARWGEYFGDPNVTVAALDRILHHAVPLKILGPSYRTKSMEERLKAEAAQRKAAEKKAAKKRGKTS